jgi:hypothetical protein
MGVAGAAIKHVPKLLNREFSVTKQAQKIPILVSNAAMML